MSLLAVLLAAVGVTDLVRLTVGPLHRRVDLWGSSAAGFVVALLVAVGLGHGWHAVWIAVVAAGVVAAWNRPSPLPWALPAAGVLALMFGQHVPRHVPPLDDWYASLEVPGLAGVSLHAAALGLAVVVFLVESANVVVRRVLREAGEGVLAEENQLKGGRILGPLERIGIFALALSGNVAAVSAVVAAKGILRFPEISRDDQTGLKAEYVLVGSFVSWALALAFVPLF